MVDLILAVSLFAAFSAVLVMSRWLLFTWWMIGAFVGFAACITVLQLVRAAARHRASDQETAWLTPEERFRVQLASALGRARRFEEQLVVVHLELARESSAAHASEPALIDQLRAKLRSYDVAEQTDDGTIVVMLPNVHDADEAIGIAERLRHSLDESRDADVHAGWCSYPLDGNSVDELLARARIACAVARTGDANAPWTHRSSVSDALLADEARRADVLDLLHRAATMRGANFSDMNVRDSATTRLALQLDWTEYETLLACATNRIWDARTTDGELDEIYDLRQLHVRQAGQLLVSYNVVERPPLSDDEARSELSRSDDIAAVIAALDVVAARGGDVAAVLDTAHQLRPSVRPSTTVVQIPVARSDRNDARGVRDVEDAA